MTLILPKTMYDEIVAHTKEGGQDEICGIIAGKDGRAVKLYRVTNVAQNKPVTYEMSPTEQLHIFQEMEKQGWELLAIYHSHPSSPAYPSRTDVSQAFYPEAYYVICSVWDRQRAPVRAFRIVDETITEHDIVIEG